MAAQQGRVTLFTKQKTLWKNLERFRRIVEGVLREPARAEPGWWRFRIGKHFYAIEVDTSLSCLAGTKVRVSWTNGENGRWALCITAPVDGRKSIPAKSWGWQRTTIDARRNEQSIMKASGKISWHKDKFDLYREDPYAIRKFKLDPDNIVPPDYTILLPAGVAQNSTNTLSLFSWFLPDPHVPPDGPAQGMYVRVFYRWKYWQPTDSHRHMVSREALRIELQDDSH